MSKRYLGIVCLIYSAIFSYVTIFDKLKNFLAPSMQIYLKLSIIPLVIIGLVLLFNNKVTYKFKVSDLVLLLPIIFLILAGDGRLTTSFASNRTLNLNTENRTKTVDDKESKEEQVEETKEKEEKVVIEPTTNPITTKPALTNIDFEVVDSNYSSLANYITYGNNVDKYKGKTIKVRGFILKDDSFLLDGFSAIGKYDVSCCTADATFTGFILKYDNNVLVADKWYEVEGVLEKGRDREGYDIAYINVVNAKEINSSSEDQYVYPCYTYDDGSCSSVLKYDLMN